MTDEQEAIARLRELVLPWVEASWKQGAADLRALLDREKRLRVALEEAQANLQWSTGAWDRILSEEERKVAQATLNRYLAAMRTALEGSDD